MSNIFRPIAAYKYLAFLPQQKHACIQTSQATYIVSHQQINPNLGPRLLLSLNKNCFIFCWTNTITSVHRHLHRDRNLSVNFQNQDSLKRLCQYHYFLWGFDFDSSEILNPNALEYTPSNFSVLRHVRFVILSLAALPWVSCCRSLDGDTAHAHTTSACNPRAPESLVSKGPHIYWHRVDEVPLCGWEKRYMENHKSTSNPNVLNFQFRSLHAVLTSRMSQKKSQAWKRSCRTHYRYIFCIGGTSKTLIESCGFTSALLE